jgi:adenylate kinase family enzyme
MSEIKVEKNEENELPIPHIWRPSFKAIISAFVKQDYNLSSEIKKVNPVSNETAEQIKEYIEDYGDYWNVLVDLYTKEEGLSDLVMNVEVRESNNEYLIDVKLVYVP